MKLNTYPRIDRKVISELSVLNPYRSTFALILDWSAIFAIIAITELYFSWPLYIIAVMLLGGRYHALAVMVHEAAHYRLFNHKALNNWVGEIFTAWPLLANMHGYRHTHLAHHQHVNTDQDPDWIRKIDDPYFKFPKSKADFLKDLVKALLGLQFIQLLMMIFKAAGTDGVPAIFKRARIIFYLIVLSILYVTESFTAWALYWLIPIATSFSFFMYVRSAAEHFGRDMNYDDILGETRHVSIGWFEGLFFPHNVNYHLDHHLYPSIPYYNLPKLHALMMREDDYKNRAHLTDGYRKGFFYECLNRA